MNEQKGKAKESKSAQGETNSPSQDVNTQLNTISPMRLYVARCILDLKKLSTKRAISSFCNSEDEKKTCLETYTTSRSCPPLPTLDSDIKTHKSINEKEGYDIFIKVMHVFESLPINQSINVSYVAEECGADCYMVLCILTILNFLGMTSIVANKVIKKSQGISSKYLQEMIQSWSSVSIPSILETSPIMTNCYLINRKGVVSNPGHEFPYSVNPPHYDPPYHPDESLDITDNRVNWNNIPSQYRSLSIDTDLFSESYKFDNIPIYCVCDRMAEIMEKYCYLFMKELVETRHFSVHTLISQTIHLNYLYISDRLSCLRLIIFTFHYMNLIQIQSRVSIDSFILAMSDIIQVSSVFTNLITAKNDVMLKPISSKEKSLIFFKDLVQQPVITVESVRATLAKHFPHSNYPNVNEMNECITNYLQSVLCIYSQCVKEKEI